MIDIIITGDGLLEKTLFSISIQTISDQARVIVVSFKKHSFIKDFQEKIKVEEVITKEKTIGRRRQIGYDLSSGDYVLFMNAGDTFFDVFSLNNLYKIREKVSIVIGGIEHLEKKYSNYYLVGNLYLKKYLKKHHILFHDSNGLENGFQQLLFMTRPEVNYSGDIIYYQNEVVSKDFDYYNNLIQDSLFAVEKAKKRSYSSHNIARLLYDVVLTFSYFFHEEKTEYTDHVYQVFQPLLKEYLNYRKYLTLEDIKYISDINLTNPKIDEIYMKDFHEKNDL